MRYQIRTLQVLLLLALIILSTRPVQAEDPASYGSGVQFQYASLRDINSQFEQMQAELTSLRSQVQNVSHSSTAFASGDVGCGCDVDCGCDVGCSCAACCPGIMWYGGYEVTFLRPYINEAALAVPGFSNRAGTGHRFVFGAEGDGGVGARLRYWFYNHGHDTVPPAAAGSVGLDLDVLDLEVTLYERLRNWDLLVSGGVRYGRVAFGISGPILPPTTVGTLSFEGAGPTISLEAEREIGSWGLYCVGNGRGSFLVGDIYDSTGPVALLGPGSFGGDSVTVLESQLGIGWNRELQNTVLDLRLLWETQFWLVNNFGGPSNIGFSGVTIAAQLRY